MRWVETDIRLGKLGSRSAHCSCLCGDAILVLGGWAGLKSGEEGYKPEPFLFNVKSGKFSSPSWKGTQPEVFIGGTLALFNNRLVMYGGYDKTDYHSRVYVCDLNSEPSNQYFVRAVFGADKRFEPLSRAYHALAVATSLNKNVMIGFGGMDMNDCMSDIFSCSEISSKKMKDALGEGVMEDEFRLATKTASLDGTVSRTDGFDRAYRHAAAMTQSRKQVRDLCWLSSQCSTDSKDLPRPRNGHSLTTLSLTDQIVLFGGAYSFDRFLSDVHILSTKDKVYKWVSPSEGNITGAPPAERAWHTANLLPNGSVAIFGGCNASTAFADIHLLTVTRNALAIAWEQVDVLGSPPLPRYQHTATLNASGDTLIILGGRQINGEMDVVDEENNICILQIA